MEESPYLGACGVCEQGKLRFHYCPACHTVCVICDECESLWVDLAKVSDDPGIKANGSFPRCPQCGETSERWPALAPEQLALANLTKYVSGKSV
ncbi:hypothetical protein [Lignipirellula cremea]|nr:hypothetical protein [Lignipirellula cremea]